MRACLLWWTVGTGDEEGRGGPQEDGTHPVDRVLPQGSALESSKVEEGSPTDDA
jgi:hypothetical protein